MNRLFRVTSSRLTTASRNRSFSSLPKANLRSVKPLRSRLFAAGAVSAGLFFAAGATGAFVTSEVKCVDSRAEYKQTNKEVVDKIYSIKKSHPGNLMAKHFTREYFNSLSPERQQLLLKCCQSGYDNPDSGMGMYAMTPSDYDDFKEYFDRVIRDYHKIKGELKQVNNWDITTVPDGPADGKLDLTKLGLGTTSMRVRVGRNLGDFPLPGNMTRQDRVNLEKRMIGAFKKLMADPAFGGRYHTLTPNNEFSISEAEYNQLVKDHIMFKDMSADPYLVSAGISADWPYGRGCYVSQDRGFIVWVGEEDHLRVMCMKKGVYVNEVFDRLNDCLKLVEAQKGCTFAKSPEYGYVTSCPTNMGTGMRASVHIQLPHLTRYGQDVSKAKAVAKTLGLSVRGVGGEHTAAGADGTVDISPSARLCIQEAEIVVALYKGIKLLRAAELEAEIEEHFEKAAEIYKKMQQAKA